MPITVPAHQAFVLPIKLLWPRHVDATAMCIGATAPDLGYAVMGTESHSWLGALVFALPFTLVAAALIRWRAATTVFGNLPDAGWFRLHSYRVLVSRRPGWLVTTVSAVIGVVSHVLVDAFTHSGRWGSNWLHLNEVAVTVPVRGDMTTARVLQYLGHSVGSIVAIALFLHIGRRRLLEEWYGEAEVAAARTFHLSTAERIRFWGLAAVIGALALGGLLATGGSPTFSMIFAGTTGLLIAGCAVHSQSSASGPGSPSVNRAW